MSTSVVFNRATRAGRELEYVAQAIDGGHISGDGPFSKRCHRMLEEEIGCARALLTTSCTHALEMTALLLAVEPGDEIIVPSFTFVSTANAFVLLGARPVFADVRADTLNLDEARVEELIGPRTRAIVPVHYAGVGCEMDALVEIAGRRGVALVEDNAHGLCGRYRGRPLGSFGVLAAHSFHETKNFTCGEGGALAINDPALVARAEILREKGTDRSRFFRGEIDKYTWVDVGSSYLPSEILAAFLCAQLEERARIQAARRAIWQRYHDGLAAISAVRRPVVPAHCEPAWHLYHLLCATAEARDALLAHLRARGIMGVFHYLPLHRSPMGQRLAARPADCPVTDDVSARLLRLPFHLALTEADQARVIDEIAAFFA